MGDMAVEGGAYCIRLAKILLILLEGYCDVCKEFSRSGGLSLLEAWGKRRYEASFISRLTDGEAEQMETQHWIETAYDCGYVSTEVRDALLERYESLGRMLYAMVEKASDFCQKR
jgi:hypothetical protein